MVRVIICGGMRSADLRQQVHGVDGRASRALVTTSSATHLRPQFLFWEFDCLSLEILSHQLADRIESKSATCFFEILLKINLHKIFNFLIIFTSHVTKTGQVTHVTQVQRNTWISFDGCQICLQWCVSYVVVNSDHPAWVKLFHLLNVGGNSLLRSAL